MSITAPNQSMNRKLRLSFVRHLKTALRAMSNHPASDCTPKVLSLDLFDTILERQFNAHENWLSLWAQLASPQLCTTSDRLTQARRKAWRQAVLNSGPNRPDSEPTHNALLAETLRLLSHGKANIGLIRELAQIEIDSIITYTTPNPAVLDLLKRARKRGLKIVVCSDMYLPACSIAHLLRGHGIAEVDHIYVSSEHGFTKFSGRLFDHLIEKEEIRPENILHIGDNLWSDVIAAASRGIHTRWIGPSFAPQSLRQKIICAPLPEENAARYFGHHTLAPALAPALAHLKRQIEQLKPDLILYLARDGELIQRMMEAVNYRPNIPVRYALLSRRSTLTPSLNQLDLALACELLGQRRQNRGLSTLFGALAIDPMLFTSTISRAGFTILDEPIPKPRLDIRLIQLLENPDFQNQFAREITRQHTLLRLYLEDLGYFQARKIVLVDLGWRGSIQDSLAAAFGDDPTAPELHGVYLGLWDDGLVGRTRTLMNKVGILSDPRKGRHLLEAALPELGLALEPVFRARHGTVTGYRQVGDRVEAVLDDDPHRRSHEQRGEAHSDAIRQGLIAGCRLLTQAHGISVESTPSRVFAQLRLMRLAYAPTRQEITILGPLPISEGAEPQWSMPAILSSPQMTTKKSLGRLRHWAAGLESPWRAGYIAATAGAPGTVLYILFQAFWLPLPAIIKQIIRRRLLQAVFATRRTTRSKRPIDPEYDNDSRRR